MRLDVALKANRGFGPGFHMLRHVLAFIILAHHCRLAIFWHDRDVYGKGAAMSLGAISHLTRGELSLELARPFLFALVGMFFAVSGFLVTASALRSKNVGIFFANRALRILPALSVEVVLCALVLGPLVTTLPLTLYFSDHQFFRYFGNISGEITYSLPGVFLNNPWRAMVNANLWMLPAEFWCYFLVSVLIASGLLRRRLPLTLGIGAALAIAILLTQLFPAQVQVRDGTTHFTSWFVIMIFLFGALLFLNAKFVSMHPAMFVAAAAGYYFLMLFHVLGPLAGLLLAYATVWIGMQGFALFDRLVKVDMSYGIYLYGFPITQATIYFLLPHLHALSGAAQFGVVFSTAFGITVLFALMSWRYLEKPALGLRKYFAPRRRSDAAGAAVLKPTETAGMVTG